VSNKQPPLIEETNLSRAWARAFLHIVDNSGKEITPLLITVTGFEEGIPEEDDAIRVELDKCLLNLGQQNVHSVANTIFPFSLWRRTGNDRHKFFSLYLKNLPRFIALAKLLNRRGLYFQRLIDYGTGPCDGNQLEFIISEFNSRTGVRRSMLQASIFDPAKDHDHIARLGFPCLQHISFVPQGGGLILNAFYATQLILQKAYGNYLGLCRLGNFMAKEMGLIFTRLNCFTGVEKLEGTGKGSPELVPLVEAARQSIIEQDGG
jgi:hypothetical protein